MKIITISLSDKCIQNPKCSFCYLTPKVGKSRWGSWWGIRDILDSYRKKSITICFEYNGYGLSPLFNEWHFDGFNLTMTTMSLVITDTFCKAMKKQEIKAISLSYDSQKVKTPLEWYKKAKIIKDNEIQLGCNFLIEKVPFKIPVELLRITDQLNLLSLKPLGKYSQKELDFINLKIESLKPIIPITVDNCLGVQLGLIDECKRGKDFIHILPNGKKEDCCFKEKCFLFTKAEEAL